MCTEYRVVWTRTWDYAKEEACAPMSTIAEAKAHAKYVANSAPYITDVRIQVRRPWVDLDD